MDKQRDMAEAGADDELSVPRAALNKMIKELIPKIRVANDARELILNCCTEFIHVVASEANEVCVRQQKKTINPDHVLEALGTLGFGDYKEEAKAVLQEAKAVAAKKRRGSTRLENLGIPEEELLRQQQELFEQARQNLAQEEQQRWLQYQQMLMMQQAQQQQQQQTSDPGTGAAVAGTSGIQAEGRGDNVVGGGGGGGGAPETPTTVTSSVPSSMFLPSVGNISIPPFPKPTNDEDDDYS